jgi:sulfonate transport system substrate-binding protein
MAVNVLRVGGVPEHFNILWSIAAERGLFEKHGIRVDWTVQSKGTGEMITSLRNDTLDVVVALTECILTDAAATMLQQKEEAIAAALSPVVLPAASTAAATTKRMGLKILGTYVQSSLCWAVSCGPQCDGAALQSSLDTLKGKTWAISRFGSGSHLMAYVLAQSRGWDTRADAGDVKFHVAGDIHGLIKAVSLPVQPAEEGGGGGGGGGVGGGGAAAAADLFMWETFTTKPYHDKGVVQRVGEFYTPWCVVERNQEVVASRGVRAVLRMQPLGRVGVC